MTQRAEILRRLAEFQEAPDPLLAELRTLPFDWSGEPLLILTKQHFLSVLDRFLDGQLSEAQLQDWAECLETREDVGFDPAHAGILTEIQFWLANPEINFGISREAIRKMREQICGFCA